MFDRRNRSMPMKEKKRKRKRRQLLREICPFFFFLDCFWFWFGLVWRDYMGGGYIYIQVVKVDLLPCMEGEIGAWV